MESTTEDFLSDKEVAGDIGLEAELGGNAVVDDWRRRFEELGKVWTMGKVQSLSCV